MSAEARDPEATFTRQAVEAELRRRAQWQLEQTRLVVDYYRVGRKIAYPLRPLEQTLPGLFFVGLPKLPQDGSHSSITQVPITLLEIARRMSNAKILSVIGAAVRTSDHVVNVHVGATPMLDRSMADVADPSIAVPQFATKAVGERWPRQPPH